MPLTKEQVESELERLKEGLDALKSRVDLMQILAEKEAATPTEAPNEGTVPVIQINDLTTKKRYFCKTPEEQRIFQENNPGVDTESFAVELTPALAKGFLDDPENKKQFTRQEVLKEA